jgi:hypothetical protein
MEIKFTKLSDGTAEEYRFLEELDSESNTHHVDNIIALFKTTDHETGYPLSPMWLTDCRQQRGCCATAAATKLW